MTSKGGLANLFCLECQEQTLHRGNACIHCASNNTSSSRPPIPKPYERFNTIRHEQHNAAVAEQGAARRRARAARHQVMQRGRS